MLGSFVLENVSSIEADRITDSKKGLLIARSRH